MLISIITRKNKQRVVAALCSVCLLFVTSCVQQLSKTKSGHISRIDIPKEGIHFEVQEHQGKRTFLLPKIPTDTLNKYLNDERIWQENNIYIFGTNNTMITNLKDGKIILLGGGVDGFYKNKKESSFKVLYTILPITKGYDILPYEYNEQDNRLYIKDLSSRYIPYISDTLFLYSVNKDSLIFIESKHNIVQDHEGWHLHIYTHPSLDMEQRIKTSYKTAKLRANS